MSGYSAPPVSRITLGTMRLSNAGDEGEAAALLAAAYDMGVRSFHCSAEYETYPLFTAAWARAGLSGNGATLIAKLASPHFGEDRFSVRQVRDKIEGYLASLKVERIDTVQWLLRHDLAPEAASARMRILDEAREDIADLVATLKREGKIAAFSGFPYTRPIADALVDAPWCDALAVYANPIEREMDPVIAACSTAGKPVLAIRPFAAGRVFTESRLSPAEALDHVFAFPAVATAIVSCSSRAHLAALLSYAVAAG